MRKRETTSSSSLTFRVPIHTEAVRMLTEKTLVLGGGGLWGIAWMIGVIMGLEESGLDVRRSRAVIGTSAGSVVGAHVTSTLATTELYERQAVLQKQPRQRAPDTKNQQAAFSLLLKKNWSDPEERLRAIVDLALNAQTIPWAQRRADIVERLGLESDRWPTTPLLVTALDIDIHTLHTFDAASNVSLTDAIAASCAVPGIWPVAEIGRRRYIDGGVWRTAENAHLAIDTPSVLILSPFGRQQAAFDALGSTLDDDIAQLRQGGSQVVLIAADEPSLATIGPLGPLDPATRKPAAEAGRVQGRREASALRQSFI
ncbi:MAG: patatin-like phospholipase family protein [Steroidobacteraceae bacterium]